jgi:hypothetical protein
MSEKSTTKLEAMTSSTNKEYYLDVTVEQYEAMKAKGIEEELLFKPGRHVFRRRPAHKIAPRTQFSVLLNLDAETFAYFQRRAAEQNAATVEEQIQAEINNLVKRDAA